MSQILNKVRDVDPNNSDAVKDALAGFFQNLCKHTEVECSKWLRILEDIITRFPKYCMSHRNTIENYLIQFLDSANYYNVIEAAKCAHALQQVRPPQQKTATAKSCWREQMNELCDATHDLISAIFPQTADIYKYTSKQKEPQTSAPLFSALNQITKGIKSQGSKDKHTLICTRLRNVFVFLQAMLVEIYPVAKPIRPQTILNVIVRALSISSGTNLPSNIQPSDITMVKTQALRSLDALIACLGSNLIPFSPLIFRFVMQTLKWSSENPSQESRKVRITAYNSLTNWLNSLHTHRAESDRGRCWEDELTNHVIDDVTPPRHVVQLTMSNQSTKHLSKKAKRRLANTMLQESSIATYMPGEKNKVPVSEQGNDDVAIAALECGEAFLSVCGIFLKLTTHKRFQERLVRECYNLSSYALPRAICLLRVLEACRKSSPPSVPPPTQYCLQLYSVMVNNGHTEISRFCTQALLDIRLHLHCSPPSLNFAIEIPQNKVDNKKKKMTERNRAALEALLGTKMPAQEDEEIITIADEPSRKKPRLDEDITDKISVSSESSNSIEISDDSDEEDSVLREVEVVIENVRESDSTDKENIIVEDESDDEIDGNDITELETNDAKICDSKTVINVKTQIVQKDINNKQIEEAIEADSTEQDEIVTIYDAVTQIPVNTSDDTIDEDVQQLSQEIAYDFPNTGKEKQTVLEMLEDENLPSTNDTDDIQITCGQVVKYSQEADSDKKSTEPDSKPDDPPKINGVDKSPVKVTGNGISSELVDKNGNTTAKVTTNDVVTVEDMLADFVDEVNEDITQGNT